MLAALKRLVPWLIGAAVLAALVWAFRPRPVEVDVAVAERGPMRVTVDEDGRTRIRERYIVSAPLSGRLLRVELEEGDPVVAGQTVLARIEPQDPSLLDPRARAEARLRVRAAEAALARAEPELASAVAALEYAEAELARLREAAQRGGATQDEVDQAVLNERTAAAAVRAAEFAREIARYELELAQAAQIEAQEGGEDPTPDEPRFVIRSPITGRVLRVIQESAAVVAPGTPLMEVGDPSELEIEVDVLSRDAVRVEPGHPVLLEHWGGDRPLHGVVRLVESSGFTKISALGVEEQRVNVIIDFAPDERRPTGLGDAYRVEARIVVWEGDDVLRVPNGALFRHGGEWAVYLVEDGRAALRTIRIGERNQEVSQVLEGLDEGDVVVLHPGDAVMPGVRVAPRP